ncbi:MAG: histidine kinase [Blautia sp.]|nr:histidine kinase [Lachnoclostridium sp.]MCM1210742.1 histidine kinase [Blautia sp.]
MTIRQRITHKNQYSSYSLVGNTKLLILLAIFIIGINIIISAISIINIRKQNFEVTQNSVDLFLQENSKNLQSIQHFIQWTILKELLIQEIEETNNDYEQFLAKAALQIRVENQQYATGYEYHYFLYLTEQDLFFNASQMTLPYSDYQQIKSFVINHATTETKQSFQWQFVEFNDTIYTYNILTYNNRTFCAFAKISDQFAPLSALDLGKQGYFSLSDLTGNTLLVNPPLEEKAESNLFYSLHIFHGDDYNLPYNIALYSDNFHNYGRLFLFQLFVILTSTCVCIILAAFIINMYRKVIKPISLFSANLEKLNEESDVLDFQSSRVRELEQTNMQFKNLIRQIKNLKINIYENELEKKRFQITFLQHQIRPHFYLNCLTTIGSMAQLEDYQNIESMVLFTSRYLRYLFQADKELVRLEYELSHIQAYLDIQQLRLGSFISYICTVDEEQKGTLIPPLLLITFIENTIKHNPSTKERLQIQLFVTKELLDEHHYLKIDIIDSGQGFPKNVLDRLSLQENINVEEQSHIGISNSIQRLTLLYGDNHKVRFFNEEQGGAHIQLTIPYQMEDMK